MQQGTFCRQQAAMTPGIHRLEQGPQASCTGPQRFNFLAARPDGLQCSRGGRWSQQAMMAPLRHLPMRGLLFSHQNDSSFPAGPPPHSHAAAGDSRPCWRGGDTGRRALAAASATKLGLATGVCQGHTSTSERLERKLGTLNPQMQPRQVRLRSAQRLLSYVLCLFLSPLDPCRRQYIHVHIVHTTERADCCSIPEHGREHQEVARLAERSSPPVVAQAAGCQWARGALPALLVATGARRRSAKPTAGALLP